MNDAVRLSLEPLHYTDADTFELERKQLYSNHWWLIATELDVSENGEYVCVDVGPASVIVARDQSGVLRAFHNICRHRSGPLVADGRGRCRSNLLVCRYHGWSYDLEGRLRNAHGLQEQIELDKYGLLPIRVDTWNGMVFVCLGTRAPSLHAWLGELTELATAFPATANMRFQEVIERTANTNWKCYGDNSCEGYHVALVHRSLSASTAGEQIEISSNEKDQFVRFDVRYTATADDPSRDGKGLWIYKFPGLLLHFSEYGFNAESVLPLAADRLRLSRWFWFDAEEVERRSVDPQAMVVSSAQVVDEDIDICERVYRNLQSGFAATGLVSPAHEPGTTAFQRWVRALYSAADLNVSDAQ